MSTSVIPGNLVTANDAEGVAAEAAKRLGSALRDTIRQRGAVSLALSGGNTPRPAYERLAKEGGIDWTKVSIFWIDERAVPPTSDRSNYRLAKETLLDRVPIPPENVHRMLGEAKDLDQAAKDYEALLQKQLGSARPGGAAGKVAAFDVAVMGIGDDGHTASLFPGDATVHVRDRLVLPVAAAPTKGREARLTVTTPVIEEIDLLLVLVAGAAKREPLQRIYDVAGSVDETPSRILRDVQGKLFWILDKAAAGVG